MQFAYLPGFVWADYLMISPPTEMGKRPISTESVSFKRVKLSKQAACSRLRHRGISDVIGAFATLAPRIVWTMDIGTALLLFVILGWQRLLLPGLALEAVPGVGVVPFWLLIVGAIAFLGSPRPKIG
jgi:hypothetical protein